MDFSESAYGALLEEIFLRFPSVQKTDFARAYKPGLEGMEAFCEALGHPERSFRSIHVAGTNGKGSVASLLVWFREGRNFPPRRFATLSGQMLRKVPPFPKLRKHSG